MRARTLFYAGRRDILGLRFVRPLDPRSLGEHCGRQVVRHRRLGRRFLPSLTQIAGGKAVRKHVLGQIAERFAVLPVRGKRFERRQKGTAVQESVGKIFLTNLVSGRAGHKEIDNAFRFSIQLLVGEVNGCLRSLYRLRKR